MWCLIFSCLSTKRYLLDVSKHDAWLALCFRSLSEATRTVAPCLKPIKLSNHLRCWFTGKKIIFRSICIFVIAHSKTHITNETNTRHAFSTWTLEKDQTPAPMEKPYFIHITYFFIFAIELRKICSSWFFPFFSFLLVIFWVWKCFHMLIRWKNSIENRR